MEYCMKCSTGIDKTSQHYITGELGPEIISVLEQKLNREINHTEVICSKCFPIILQEISTTQTRRTGYLSPSRSKKYKKKFSCDSKNKIFCVWCLNSLFNKRAQTIPAKGSMRNLISERISPRIVPENCLVCYKCWVRARTTLHQHNVLYPPSVTLNACVWCRRSLARTRRHTIPEGPERDEITARIQPRKIPPGGLVCYACWVSARRAVQQTKTVKQTQEATSTHVTINCAWCEISLYGRQTHILSHGPERNVVAARIYPSELPENAILCSNCWTRAQENMELKADNLDYPAVINETFQDDVTMDSKETSEETKGLLPIKEEPSDLNPDPLSTSGDLADAQYVYGDNIHQSIVEKITPILKKGLPDILKKELLKDYDVPENCKLLGAPALNTVLSEALSDQTRDRDKNIQLNQNQLGFGVTAVSRALTTLLVSDDKLQAIKMLTDACRILSDLHHNETIVRRNLIISCLDKSMKEEQDHNETL